MSRTYRKRCEAEDWWVLEELVRVYPFTYVWVKRDPQSKEYKKELAKYHSDSFRSFREPGPARFRNLFEERPLRRQNKRELQRFMQDSEYEPLIDAKQRKRVYWT